MSHESGTGIPRVGGQHVTWERAEPLVWSELRKLQGRSRESMSGIREIGTLLREIDHKLIEAKVIDKTLIEDIAEVREKIRRLWEEIASLRTDDAATKIRVHSLEKAGEYEDKALAKIDKQIRVSRPVAIGGGVAALGGALYGLIHAVGQLLGWW
jgi:hypothetical protein